MIKLRGNSMLHYLDRYAGIPAVVVLGHIRRKRPAPSTIQTIGLLKLGAIGDTVLMSAVIADLRHAFPNALITFFSDESNFEIAGMLEGVNRVVKIPTCNLAAGVRTLRSIAIDVIIDFGQWSRLEALLALFSHASFTVGFRTPRQYRHCGYDLDVEHSPDVHELENYRKLVRSLGVETRSRPFLRPAREALAMSGPFAVLHLWPAGKLRKLKEWPADRWIRLIDDLVDHDMDVVLTGAESDYACNDALIALTSSRSRGLVKNAAGVSLQQTASILAQASLVVSVNTGVMHMAAALGVPLVALHGPTSSKRWGPVSEAATIIDSPLAGCGYLNLGWERPLRALACMECIPYEMVRDACLAITGMRPPAKRTEPSNVALEGIGN
jgi:ADP-heptose:LPS heptosyltransferase